jgi:hypothetical protein
MSNIANAVVSPSLPDMQCQYIINCLTETSGLKLNWNSVECKASFLQTCWHGLRDQFTVSRVPEEGRRQKGCWPTLYYMWKMGLH